MSETSKPIATLTSKINDLRPTQMSVGMIEVRDKIKEAKGVADDAHKLSAFLKDNAVPGVLGPKNLFYIIDHHHMARALYEACIDETVCNILEDLSHHEKQDEFWKEMSDKKWVYPYDENGKGPRPYDDIPSHVKNLKNDPYRSLAGALREAGGYAKTDHPFAEFLWADFLRNLVPIGEITKENLPKVVRTSLKFASSSGASELPGYISHGSSGGS